MNNLSFDKVDPEEIIQKLRELIIYFEKAKAKNNNEEKLPDTFIH